MTSAPSWNAPTKITEIPKCKKCGHLTFIFLGGKKVNKCAFCGDETKLTDEEIKRLSRRRPF